MKKYMSLLFIALLVVASTYCDDKGGDNTVIIPTETRVDTDKINLYVANWSSGSVGIYYQAGLVGWSYGAIYPDRNLFLAVGTDPAGLWVDKKSDTLYVGLTGTNQIMAFDDASTTNGFPIPARTITGVDDPYSIQVSDNTMYVANYNDNTISIYTDASKATGAVAPAGTISHTGTYPLLGPTCLTVDTTPSDDEIYVTSYNNDYIHVFRTSDRNDVAPQRTIRPVGAYSHIIDAPYGLYFDAAHNRLYVTSLNNNSILVYENANTLDGAVPYNTSISAAVIDHPTGIWVDSRVDCMYITSNFYNRIVVIPYLSEHLNTAGGTSDVDLDPDQLRTISQAGDLLLDGPSSVWLDTNAVD